jgi:hypothetical protein
MTLPGANKALNFSRKRIQIDKANTTMILIVGVTAVLVVFALVSARALYSQHQYQQRVITARKKSSDDLLKNKKSLDLLVEDYKAFENTPESVIGTKDSNSKLILDALPSKYDAPAVYTSLYKVLKDGGYAIESTSVPDNVKDAVANSSSPEPIEIPFNFTVRTGYDGVTKLISTFEKSLRPINVTSIEMTGGDNSVRLLVNGKTYYQPEKSLEIKTKVIK